LIKVAIGIEQKYTPKTKHTSKNKYCKNNYDRMKLDCHLKILEVQEGFHPKLEAIDKDQQEYKIVFSPNCSKDQQ